MEEKAILNDLLGGAKASVNSYTHAILEASSPELRSTLQTLREEAEKMQYDLYKMAEQKGYYQAAPKANKTDVNSIKTSLTSSIESTNLK